MPDTTDHLDEVAAIVQALTVLGLEPVLVGGMALVMLGSRRVTRDFDFVIAHPRERLQTVVDLFYDRGLELASRVDQAGEVTATIDNRRVAAIRLRLDAPFSVYFFNPKTGLRVDLLFDFPMPAHELAGRARRVKVRSQVFRLASEADLLRLKQITRDQRALASDAEDIAFLKGRRKPSQRRGSSRE